MNNKTDEFYSIIERHKQALSDLEGVLANLGYDSLMTQNSELLREVDIHQKTILEQQTAIDNLQQTVLQEKEKSTELVGKVEALTALSAANISKGLQSRIEGISQLQVEKLNELYNNFTNYLEIYSNKSEILQQELKSRYNNELVEIKTRLKADVETAQKQLDEMSKQIEDKVVADSLELAKASDTIQSGSTSNAAKSREVLRTKEAPKTKDNKGFMSAALEMKWGLNIVNKIGMILILLSVVLAGQYVYINYFGDVAKSALFYTLGASFLALGHYLSNKSYRSLAMVLIGGGIGILYAATFISAFYLELMPLTAALLISVGIATLSIVMAWLQKSQVLAMLALAGGYLPILAYVVVEGIDSLPVMGALVYIFLLNLVMIVLSIKMSWRAVIVQSFIFDALCINALALLLEWEWLALFVVFINFLLYFGLIISGHLVSENDKGNGEDSNQKVDRTQFLSSIIFSLNGIVHVMSSYIVLDAFNRSSWSGVVTITFAVIYLLLWLSMKGKVKSIVSSHLGKLKNLSFLMSCGLFALAVPMQFQESWEMWFYGWLLEGVVLWAYSYLDNNKRAQIWGSILLVMSVFIFISHEASFFNFKRAWISEVDVWAALLAISFGVLSAMYVSFKESNRLKDRAPGDLWDTLDKIMILSALIWTGVVIAQEVLLLCHSAFGFVTTVESCATYSLLILGMLYFANAYKLDRFIPLDLLKDTWSFLLLLVSVLVLLSVESTEGLRFAIEIVLLVVLNSMACFGLNRLIKKYFLDHLLEQRVALIAIYLLIAYILHYQVRIEGVYAGFIFNFTLILFSIAYTAWGYVKQYHLLRKVGLLLALLTTAKLLLLDSSGLPLEQKIISYFGFGLALLGISVVYQKLENASQKSTPKA